MYYAAIKRKKEKGKRYSGTSAPQSSKLMAPHTKMYVSISVDTEMYISISVDTETTVFKYFFFRKYLKSYH